MPSAELLEGWTPDVEDLSYEEAAWVLRVPVGTLRSRLARGREQLRQLRDAQPREAGAEQPPLRRVK